MRKACLHLQEGWRGDLGHPPVLKLVDVSVAYVRQVRATVGPDTQIIVRKTQPNEYQPLDNPRVRADRFVQRGASEMLEMSNNGQDRNIAWEAYNEIPDARIELYVEFERERLAAMHMLGLASVVDNSGVGMRNDVWPQVVGMIDAMDERDIYGIHDYVAVPDDLDNPWYCARWRRTDVLDNVRIVVTEYGVDCIQDRERHGLWPGVAGWKKHYNREEFLEILRAGDRLYCRFPNVLGFCAFTVGKFAKKWNDFDVADVWSTVVAEQEEWQPQAAVASPGGVQVLPIPGSRISQKFGENPDLYAPLNGHPGIDLAAPAGWDWREWHGAAVYSTVAGLCHALTDDTYGRHTYTFGENGYDDELWGHLAEHAFEGRRHVVRGTLLGWTGYTGRCIPTGGPGTHAHWGKRPRPYKMRNGFRGYVNPLCRV